MVIKYILKATSFIWSRFKKIFLLLSFLTILMGLIPYATLWTSKQLVNSVAFLLGGNKENYSDVLFFIILQICINLINSLLQVIYNNTFTVLQLKLDLTLEGLILNKASNVPLIYFEDSNFFNHMERIRGNQGSRFLSPIRTFLSIIKSSITLVSYVYFLFSIHWILVIINAILAIPIVWLNKKLGNMRFNTYIKQTPILREAYYLSYLLKDKQAAKEIRLFNLGQYFQNRWLNNYNKNIASQLFIIKKQQKNDFIFGSLSSIFYGISSIFIIWLIKGKSINIGEFVAITEAAKGTQSSINDISINMALLYEQSLFIQDFFSFFDYNIPNVQLDSGHLPITFPLKNGIRLENVSFQYLNSDKPVLKNITLNIKSGEKIAIVGDNGSGKTTLIKCILGLYPIMNGNIFYDDIPIENISREFLYKGISTIFQDYTKYFFSIKENIFFGDVAAYGNSHKLQEASLKSGVTEFTSNLEKGFETILGNILPDGVDLSGGQWQKVSLARAMFRDAELYIFDEPTSALDPQSELEIYHLFSEISKDKTALFITHRMASAQLADRIIVLKDGEVIETGTHDELLQNGYYYKEMFDMQAGWYKESLKEQETYAWT